MSFPYYRQLNAMDCGPTCLRMIAKYYGKHYNASTLRQKIGFNKQGVSLLGISETAEKLGFRTHGARLTLEKLYDVPLPCILHWNQNHFVVLTSMSKRGVKVADPAKGLISYTIEELERYWISSQSSDKKEIGIVLAIEPTPLFYNLESEKETKLSWSVITRYLRPHRWAILQVFLAFIMTSCIQLIFPFLAKSIVDVGINTQNLQFITIVLIAQIVLTLSSTTVEFIRGRIMMRLSNILSISVLSDFWIKLTHLPISYFNSHQTGDIMQRIGDNSKIRGFLMGSVLSSIFSLFNFIIYAFILVFFNSQLFFVFLIGNIIYILWIRFFLGVRRKLNYEIFSLSAKENNATLQLILGMQEIKLNNAEKLKRWEWESVQANIFRLNFRSLNYGQLQSSGALLINQGKDFVISFLVAKMVVEGRLTFGTMLAVQYIIGQLSAPVSQLVGLIQSGQDAKISMERLNEIHNMEVEEAPEKNYIQNLPENKSIQINNLSFTYPGAGNDPVLKNLTLTIPENKITAIVGVSGSGKTTLLKLLLKFYEDIQGEIKVGNSNLKHIGASFWRSQCGSVLQDGYMFNDTIAGNIAVGEELEDYDKLMASCKTANILEFIESLPNGFYTKLGSDGVDVSQGQKQRILIARAIYKNPAYLFFDEATNALDANNEKAIVENFDSFFKHRTAVIVAHRLSTVKNADNIIVLSNGEIAEQGTHYELIYRKGMYYELVKNQLELAN